MSFSLLAPAALFLGVLLLGPVLAHLTRRQPTDTQAFGLMFLLDRLQRQVERRRRVQDWLLLLLRIAAIALLIAAASRPEIRLPETASTFGSTGRVVVLLDNSLSMDQRVDGEPLLASARQDAAATIRKLPDGVKVALITAGGTAAQVSGLEADHELVATEVEQVQQLPLGTDLHGALLLTRELLGEEPGEVLIYTDESGPGVIERCADDLAWLQQHGTAILPRIFAPPVRRNIVPVSAEYGDGLEGGTVSVKLANYGADPREVPATIALPDGSPITVFLQVPGANAGTAETPGTPGVAEGRFTVPRQVAGGVASLSIDEPDLPLDNLYYFHLPRIGASRVLVVDGEPGSTPTTSEVYFLERALAPFGNNGVAVDVVAPSGIASLDPTRHRVAFVANVGDPGMLSGALVDFVRKGGGLFLSMGRNVSAERFNSALGSILPTELLGPRQLVSPDDQAGAPLAVPDPGAFELFAPFARGGLEGFSRVRVLQAMGLGTYQDGPDMQTILRTRDGAPLLVSRRIGSGRVVVWTSTLDLAWSNLPLQSIFVPFVQRLVGWMGGDVGGAVARLSAVAGEAAELKLPQRGMEPEITDPEGHFLQVSRSPDSLRFVPMLPGAHTVKTAEGPPMAWVAVNTPASESDIRQTTTLQEARLASLPDTLQRHISLVPGLLLAAIAALAGAAILGGRRDDA